MISTESGYEDWLEQRRVAFVKLLEKKLTQKNQQNQEQKRILCFLSHKGRLGTCS